MKSRCPCYSPFVCVCVCVCVCVYGGVGGLVTNDWCIIHRNKDEMLDKVFGVFISFISPILYKIIEEAKHNRLIISAPLSIRQPTNGKGTYCFSASPNDRHRS